MEHSPTALSPPPAARLPGLWSALGMVALRNTPLTLKLLLGRTDLKEAALLLLVIDDVQRVKQSHHSRICAYEDNEEPHCEGRPQGLVRLPGKQRDLIGDEGKRSAGQDAREDR